MENAKTIKEIAQLAKVSTATVSRIINQNGRFSQETEERVLRVIAENDYMPNMSARGLRTSRTKVIGIIVPDITNPHFASLVLKLEMELFVHGYSCLICNTNESQELEKKHIQSQLAQNVSGVVIISGTRHYAELTQVPVVYVDRPSRGGREEGGVMIESDNPTGGYLATRALLDAGCRHIAILKCLANDYNQIARYEGYKRALVESGVVQEKALRLNLELVSVESAYNAILKLVDEGVRFDGIMATTDTMAAGALIALRERGLEVPRDVLVTGFDDCQLAAACGCGLTSVHQDVTGMAHRAVALLLQMLQGVEPECRYFLLPVTLTERASTRR